MENCFESRLSEHRAVEQRVLAEQERQERQAVTECLEVAEMLKSHAIPARPICIAEMHFQTVEKTKPGLFGKKYTGRETVTTAVTIGHGWIIDRHLTSSGREQDSYSTYLLSDDGTIYYGNDVTEESEILFAYHRPPQPQPGWSALSILRDPRTLDYVADLIGK